MYPSGCSGIQRKTKCVMIHLAPEPISLRELGEMTIELADGEELMRCAGEVRDDLVQSVHVRTTFTL